MKKNNIIYEDIDLNKVDLNIERLNKEITADFEQMSECLNNALDISTNTCADDNDNINKEAVSEGDDGIIITVIESKINN